MVGAMKKLRVKIHIAYLKFRLVVLTDMAEHQQCMIEELKARLEGCKREIEKVNRHIIALESSRKLIEEALI